jgi:eukaryotic-like serine/threonine-protein kinase
MMTTVLHCPNTACGRLSHLSDDPLGRIFRCPRCLTKLPAASATAADSRWSAVAGSSQLGSGQRSFRLIKAWHWVAPNSTLAPGSSDLLNALAFRAEGLANALEIDSAYECPPASQVRSGLGPDDSGEVLIEPVLADSRSGSVWRTTSASSVAAVTTGRGSSKPVDANLFPRSEVALGRFRLLSLLGKGEHATVYRAYDPILERDIALKVPRHGVLKTAKVLDRFLGEAKALARLRHARIVPIYEAGRAGKRYYIAMALIEGHSLAERLTGGPLAINRAAEIVAELAEALAYAHTQGVIHRDVKPANVRLDNQGAVYLMDFGIAYRPDSGEIPLPPGMILGTPAYVAPEQAQGGQTGVLPASDQYSLGVVFYELLCGRPPFCGPPSYVMFHTIHRTPSSPRAFTPQVPRSLAAICLKALAKCPDERYRNCQHLADDLRRWLSGETPQAYRRTWAHLMG